MKRSTRLLCLLATLVLAGCPDAPAPSPGGPIGTGSGPKGPVIRIRFEDAKGRPVPGVHVLARMSFAAGPEGLAGIEADGDADGVVIVDVEGRLHPVADAPVHFTATAPGCVPRRWQAPGFQPGIGMGITVRLDPAGAVAGRVVDERGEPVADAFVFLLAQGRAGCMREDEVFSARTDAGGDNRIDPAPGGILHVCDPATGAVPAAIADVTIRPPSATELETLMLRIGSVIAGQVTTPDGSPVEGARVRAWRNRDYADFRYFGPSSLGEAGGVAETDETGEFRIDGLADGVYTVDAARLGYSVVDAERSGVPAGAEGLRLVLEKGFELTLVVTDAKTKAPIGKFRAVLAELDGPKDLERRPIMVDDRQPAPRRAVPAGDRGRGLRHREGRAGPGRRRDAGRPPRPPDPAEVTFRP